jgi:integrase
MRGSIVKRPSGRYAVVVELDRDPVTGKRRQRWHGGHRTRKQAESALTAILGRIQRGEYVETTTQTLGEYLTAWLSASRSRIRPSTWESYDRNVRVHVTPTLGGRRLQALTPADLNALYAQLLTNGKQTGKGGALSPRTVRYVHTIVRRALKDAVRQGAVTRNVADLADPPSHSQAKPSEMQTWTPDQTRRYLTHVEHDRLTALWRLACTTGMRRGELLGLKWGDVDLANGRVSIRRALIQVKYEIAWSEPKTTASRRQVSIDPATIAALSQHQAAQDVECAMWGDAYHSDGLVFCHEDGQPIYPELLTAWFTRHAKAAGLPTIRLHDLRHTHATHLLQLGVHPKVVADRLGHGDPALTLRVYSHVIPAVQETVAALAADLIASSGE